MPSVPRLVVVIPCRDEPDPLATLKSLARCDPVDVPVEVIVVVNGSDGDGLEILRHNESCFEILESWSRTTENLPFTTLIRHHPQLPERHAGVGLARKIGMDEAALRLLGEKGTKKNGLGVIVALDADCQVAPNYFTALLDHFHQQPETAGASIYFEHPLEGLSPRHRDGILGYELFLRTYRLGLLFAGSPHAYHTVGSAMAVNADVYRRLGGMNRRKAGEDFYFLQKIMAHGPFADITTTTVFPSPRVSHRVPFGTGRAMGKWFQEGPETVMTYDPKIFLELRGFFVNLQELFSTKGDPLPGSSLALAQFLEQQQFSAALSEIRANTSSPSAFMKRFFLWFNPFRLLKFAHFATDLYYPKIPVALAAAQLLEWMGVTVIGHHGDPLALLCTCRQLDRCGTGFAIGSTDRLLCPGRSVHNESQ